MTGITLDVKSAIDSINNNGETVIQKNPRLTQRSGKIPIPKRLKRGIVSRISYAENVRLKLHERGDDVTPIKYGK